MWANIFKRILRLKAEVGACTLQIDVPALRAGLTGRRKCLTCWYLLHVSPVIWREYRVNCSFYYCIFCVIFPVWIWLKPRQTLGKVATSLRIIWVQYRRSLISLLSSRIDTRSLLRFPSISETSHMRLPGADCLISLCFSKWMLGCTRKWKAWF